MTMGNVVSRKGPLFTDPEIAEAECIEYTPTGLHKISENPNAFGAVNPCHPNTMKYIKRMINEIFTNPKYECVDAYVLDYCRYMNFNSDFSDYSREQFEAYIGESVPNWISTPTIRTPSVHTGTTSLRANTTISGLNGGPR